MSTLKNTVVSLTVVAGLVTPAVALACSDQSAKDHGHQTKFEQTDHKSNENHDNKDKNNHDRDHESNHDRDHESDHDRDCNEGGQGSGEPTPTPSETPEVTPEVTPTPTATPVAGGNGNGTVLTASTTPATLPETGANPASLEIVLAAGLAAAGFMLVKRQASRA